ncbi:cytochrome P450 4C1-like [Cylas formicarius]|uniref:cytochrome P450 4C1-like n=1 Tax=Cylas formicarius TaxID=197179 RepID=UPI0029586DDD|nr:cytochrome P450 4C1-like [Cylas formicarius]
MAKPKVLPNPKLLASDVQLIIFLAFFVTLTAFYVNFLWRKRKMFIQSWNVPGPINLPIIGAAYLFMCRPDKIYSRLTKLQARFPKVTKLWFGSRLLYCLQEPSYIEKMLNNPKMVEKDYLYKHLVDCIGHGLMTAPGPMWRKHRKAIMPSFNQKILDSFVEVFAEQSRVLTDILEQHRGKKMDTLTLVARCTLDIVCETAMGLQLSIQKTDAEYAILFDKIMELCFIKIFHIWNHNEFVWNLGSGRLLKEYLRRFNQLAQKVIEEKMELKKRRKNSEAKVEDAPKRLAFLDLIMQNSDFSAIELRDEVNIFLFAGTDTTASSLSFLLAVLGMFQDIQGKVYNEVIEIMGHDRLPEYKDLPLMKYTERVIKETLRLFPVGAFFLRAATEDLDLGDIVMPKGSSAFFGTVFIHRNPKYWPDPLKFDPDRFLPEEIAKRHPCTYIPFSYGPRNCIGMRYAMMAMKTIVANVIRRMRIYCDYKSIEEIQLKTNIVLRFRDGCKTSMELREVDNAREKNA